MITQDDIDAFSNLCPCCGDVMEPTKHFPEEHGGHQPMSLMYQCYDHACGHVWHEEWCSACDSECPQCESKNNSPISWELLDQ